MIRIYSNNFGKGINRWVEKDGKIIASIGHHPRWRSESKHTNVRDAWNVCWTTGRVDWHSTLAEARDNALKGN
jgi:hypothetical protein